MKNNQYFEKSKTISKNLSNAEGVEDGKFSNPKRKVRIVEKFSTYYYKKDDVNFPRLNAFSGKFFTDINKVL